MKIEIELPAFTLASTSGGARREATRHQIVQAAHDLLAADEAFADLSVGRIAAKAGVSRATFYLHFSDKRQLLGALAEQELTQWREVADDLFADPTAGREQLRATIRALLDLWDENRAVLSALIELAEYDEDARVAWRGAVEAVAESIAEYSRRRDDVDVADAAISGRVIAWMTERVCHQMLDGASPEERDLIALTITELVWRSRKPND